MKGPPRGIHMLDLMNDAAEIWILLKARQDPLQLPGVPIIVGIQMAEDIARGKRNCSAKRHRLTGILLVHITDFRKPLHYLASVIS